MTAYGRFTETNRALKPLISTGSATPKPSLAEIAKPVAYQVVIVSGTLTSIVFSPVLALERRKREHLYFVDNELQRCNKVQNISLKDKWRFGLTAQVNKGCTNEFPGNDECLSTEFYFLS